ncbi:MAG: hypothetical protein PUE57_05925 [Lactimicrobium massiliense]|nr:hypothetical protein [Lactimicrobium massiliense]
MFFEVKKLLKNRWLMILAAVLMILSCTVYAKTIYVTQQGNDYRIIRAYYQHPSSFLAANENIPAKMSGVEGETVDRMLAQKNYAANIQELIQQNHLKLQLGIVKTAYDASLIRKSTADFHHVVTLHVPMTFHGGIEKYCSCWYPEAAAIMICLLCCFILFLQEEKEPVRLLLHPAANGRNKLYHHKCIAVAAVSLGVLILLHIIIFLLSAFLLGNGSLQDPVQAVYGMWLFPYPIPIWAWLILSLFMKCILLCTAAFMFVMLCNYLKKEWQLLLTISMIAVVSILTYQSSNLYVRSLNLMRLMQIQEWMSSNIYLDIFSVPVNRLWIILVLSLLVQFSGWRMGFCQPRSSMIKKKKGHRLHRNCMKGNLWANEGIKYWLLEGGLLSLVIIALIQVYLVSSFHPRMTPAEMYYSKYVEELTGRKTTEKDAFLVSEKEYLEGDATGELYERYLGFQMAAEQYHQLKEHEVFTNRLSYYWLTSKTGIQAILLATMVMLAGLCYPASSTYGNEQESGMIILFQSTGTAGRIRKYKRINLAIHLLLLWLICFVPLYGKVGKIFGYYGLLAKAGIMPYWLFLVAGIAAELIAGILFISLLDKLAQKLKVRNYVLAVSLAVIFAGLLCAAL